MKANEILELVRAGYTKEEILEMDQKEETSSDQEEKESPEEKNEKKTSSEDSEGSEEKSKEDSSDIKALKDKLDSLEKKFFTKNREEASIPSAPEEDLSMKAIFTSLNKEE